MCDPKWLIEWTYIILLWFTENKGKLQTYLITLVIESKGRNGRMPMKDASVGH